jgi:hypothetical protein
VESCDIAGLTVRCERNIVAIHPSDQFAIHDGAAGAAQAVVRLQG